MSLTVTTSGTPEQAEKQPECENLEGTVRRFAKIDTGLSVASFAHGTTKMLVGGGALGCPSTGCS